MDLVKDRVSRLAEYQAAAFGCTAETDYLQPVEPVVNRPEHINAVVPVLERVIGKDRILAGFPPTLGYDDVSASVNAFGGVYLMYGVQDSHVVEGQTLPLAPRPVAAAWSPTTIPSSTPTTTAWSTAYAPMST
jgi:metal-dependent amidase/aminoacylase/carboxypeptidase family protein